MGVVVAGEEAFNRAEIAKAQASLQRVLEAAKSGGASAADRAGAEFVNALRDAVSGPSPSPPGGPPGKETGELQGSFDAAPGGGNGDFYIDVSVGAPYASFLEYGTSRMAARPFFRTTIEAETPAIGQFLADEVLRAEEGAA